MLGFLVVIADPVRPARDSAARDQPAEYPMEIQ